MFLIFLPFHNKIINLYVSLAHFHQCCANYVLAISEENCQICSSQRSVNVQVNMTCTFFG